MGSTLCRSIYVAWLLIALCTFTGCGGDSGTAGPAEAAVVQSAAVRDTDPQVTDTELARLVSGTTEFALKLLPLLASSPGENIIFSPYSITQAFAMLAPGARGNTLDGIEKALAFAVLPDRRNPAFNKLDLQLASRTAGTVLANGAQTPKLKNANAVWGQLGFSIMPGYLDTLAINFGAGMHLADFITASETSRQIINSWVEGQTESRIRDLIPPGGVSANTRLMLTNAVWFKGSWASRFQKGATANRVFSNRDDSKATVPFMQQLFSVPYARTAGCQAVDIPYAGNNLSMLVIMPDQGNMDSFLTALTPVVLADITNRLASRMVDLSLPKFSSTSSFPLRTSLQTLGMADAFDPARADFSGIDGKRDLYVEAAFHKAFISVDEEGTEAAAATGISIGTVSIPVPDLTLTIDHPFIYLIRDRLTGTILFMGRVTSLKQ